MVGLGDSLDLVPIGAWHGNGRKAQWWSPILLAVWDPNAGKLVAVCKCMSGELFWFVLIRSLDGVHEMLIDIRRPLRFYRYLLQGAAARLLMYICHHAKLSGQEMRDRYPENSETCAKTPLWDPEIETGGGWRPSSGCH